MNPSFSVDVNLFEIVVNYFQIFNRLVYLNNDERSINSSNAPIELAFGPSFDFGVFDDDYYKEIVDVNVIHLPNPFLWEYPILLPEMFSLQTFQRIFLTLMQFYFFYQNYSETCIIVFQVLVRFDQEYLGQFFFKQSVTFGHFFLVNIWTPSFKQTIKIFFFVCYFIFVLTATNFLINQLLEFIEIIQFMYDLHEINREYDEQIARNQKIWSEKPAEIIINDENSE